MARYDFVEVTQSGNGVWVSCTDAGEVGRLTNDLKAAVPGAQTRQETKFPSGEIFRLNFHGLKGQDLQVLWWVMGWLGQNSWEPVDSVLYSNMVGGDTNHGTELFYHFRRASG